MFPVFPLAQLFQISHIVSAQVYHLRRFSSSISCLGWVNKVAGLSEAAGLRLGWSEPTLAESCDISWWLWHSVVSFGRGVTNSTLFPVEYFGHGAFMCVWSYNLTTGCCWGSRSTGHPNSGCRSVRQIL